jgi:hypothetical protein
MDFGSINWVAVLLATLVTFVSGFIWFGPKTFYPIWWKALGKSPNAEPGSQQNMAVVFGSITIALFVQSLVFSIVLSWYGAKTGDLNAASGALAGLIVGVGIVAASPLSHRLMGQQGFKVWILEVGNDSLNYVLMGLVLGAML